jgi:hypothetical protein
MKKLIVLVCVAALSTSLFGQDGSASTQLAVAKWDKTTHDFGKISQGQTVTVDFTVVNMGTVPLQVFGVQRSGNCTVPEWPTKPIQPGASGVIKITYDAKVAGPFTKIVKVTTNTEEITTELLLTGETLPSSGNL